MAERLLAEKSAAEAEALSACTFRPKTGRAPTPNARARMPAPERLYHDADERYMSIELARRRLDEAREPSPHESLAP